MYYYYYIILYHIIYIYISLKIHISSIYILYYYYIYYFSLQNKFAKNPIVKQVHLMTANERLLRLQSHFLSRAPALTRRQLLVLVGTQAGVNRK